MARVDWQVKIDGVVNNRVVGVEHTLNINRPGTLRVTFATPITVNLTSTLEFSAQYWQGGSAIGVWNSGLYYVDAFQQVNDISIIDATSIKQTALSQTAVTFTDQNLNSIVNSITSKLGLTANFAAGTAFRAGTAVSGVASCIITGSNEYQAIVKAASMYGYGHFVHNNINYLVDLKYASGATAITRNSVIDVRDAAFNTIDAVKNIANIKYKSSNTLATVSVPNITYGKTFDATNDNFHETITAAQRAAIGYQLSYNSKALSANILAQGRNGYLPGQFYTLNSTEFNSLLSKVYYLDSLTQSVSSDEGWTSYLKLIGAPQ